MSSPFVCGFRQLFQPFVGRDVVHVWRWGGEEHAPYVFSLTFFSGRPMIVAVFVNISTSSLTCFERVKTLSLQWKKHSNI